MTEVILKKGGSVTLFGKAKEGDKVKEYHFALGKAVPCNDVTVLEKVKTLNTQVPGKFEISQDVTPELLPKGWEKLTDARLRTVAERFGLSNAKDTEKYPTKGTVVDAISAMIKEGTVAVMKGTDEE
jgi:hypothetical protein